MSTDDNKRNQLLYTHGLLLSLSWALCTVVGTFTACFFRRYPGWLNVHRRCQTAASILTLPLTFLSFAAKEVFSHSPHYNTYHAKIGICISVVSMAQGIVGGVMVGFIGIQVLGLGVRVKKPSFRVMRYCQIIHKYGFGYPLLILAFVNIWYGIQLSSPQDLFAASIMHFFSFYTLLVAVVGAVFTGRAVHRLYSLRREGRTEIWDSNYQIDKPMRPSLYRDARGDISANSTALNLHPLLTESVVE